MCVKAVIEYTHILWAFLIVWIQKLEGIQNREYLKRMRKILDLLFIRGKQRC